MTAPFQLAAIGGPWGKRLEQRRRGFDDYPWHEIAAGDDADGDDADVDAARLVWTQSAFSEYASAAAFAEIASALLAAAAPIDLIAAAGDFVVDEMLHAELSARVAMGLGGAVLLEVDHERLVRPAAGDNPLRRAAELLVRTSCVGEALTVPLLKLAMQRTGSSLIETVLARIVRDESAHAELGPWFLDWADAELSDADRCYLGNVAGDAIAAYAPLFGGSCQTSEGKADHGVLDCASFDATFASALQSRVVDPLALRGIVVPDEALKTALEQPAW